MSLDSLDDATFRAMNDVDFPVAKVLEGIDAARRGGLAPIKINMVVKRGINEDVDRAAWRGTSSGTRPHRRASSSTWTSAHTNGWRMDDVVPAAEIVRSIDARVAARAGRSRTTPGEVAERWRYRDGGGEIGVIASVTQAFCRDCTRARLSTDGKLYTCLFATDGYDLRALAARRRTPTRRSRNAVAAIWRQRADRYSEIRTANTPREPKVEMSYIGG